VKAEEPRLETSLHAIETSEREKGEKSRRRSSRSPFQLTFQPALSLFLAPPPPLPPNSPQSRADDRGANPEDDGASYQLDMMRCLREVNADNNTVGWYQSTSLGAFQTAELADTFAAYASTIRRAVCIVVDPDAARGGG